MDVQSPQSSSLPRGQGYGPKPRWQRPIVYVLAAVVLAVAAYAWAHTRPSPAMTNTNPASTNTLTY